jgi:transposase
MPAAKYIVDLTVEEREHLFQLMRRGNPAARKVTRARILLKADEGLTDDQVAAALHVGIATVGRVRQRFVEEGLDSALQEKPRPGQRRKLTGTQEAHLIAITCSKAPEGRARWTLRLLADQVVELGFVEAISHETVRQILKKVTSSHGRKPSGVSPR